MDDLDAMLAARAQQAQVDPLDAMLQARAQGKSVATTAAPAQPDTPLLDQVTQQAGNVVAGAVRGAGSIGATLLSPFDAAARAFNGGKPVNIGGYDILGQDRRAGMDSALTDMGAQPDSIAFQGGKLGSEIAGTLGVGGALGSAVTRLVPGVAASVPALVDAVRTGGMAANGATGVGGLAARAAGGAINGAVSAGLIDPSQAGSGAVVGAAVPLAAKGVSAAMDRIGTSSQQKLAKALEDYGRKAPQIKALQDSLEAGYVIPPATVNPTFSNRTLESVSGKMATQQLASVRNADVTDGLVRKALNLPSDSALTVGTLEGLRKDAGKAYSAVADLSPQAASDLEALKIARNESQAWYKAYNRSASPIDLAKAKELRDQATALETSLENHAQQANRPDLIPALRDARKLIAQTYTVQRAMNPATGTVDAKVLGRMLQKGDPLSGDLGKVAQFGAAFPTVAKRPEQIGTPDAHNLKTIASILGSITGGASAGPLGAAAAAAVPFVAPPIARSIMFSKALQQGLVPQAPQAGKAAQLARLLSDPAALEMFAKAAPALATAP